MTIQKKIKSHPDVINYFKELPFYYTYIEKPKIRRLKNIGLFPELPFYEELRIIKTDQAFKRYPMSYKVELLQEKDPLIQLEASKSSIKDQPNDRLDKTKGFKYQITLKVELKKYAVKLNFSCLFQFNNKSSDQNLILINLFKTFYAELITGLMKVLVGLLGQLNLNTSIFQLYHDYYQEVLM